MAIFVLNSGGGASGGGGVDTSNDTVKANYVLAPHTFHDSEGNAGTGLIYEWGGSILDGASTAGNKVTIQPASSVRHIAAGSYINREIELAAMPSGSASMAQSGNKVTLTKTAGYIPAGSQDLVLDSATEQLRLSGATVYLDRESAGYVPTGTGVLSKTVPLVNNYSVSITQNGLKTITALDGTAGFSSLIINTSVAGTAPMLQEKTVNITQNGISYASPSSSFDGLSMVTINVNVPGPSDAAGTITNNSSTLSIRCASGHTLYMAGFMASSASYANTSKVVGGYVRLGSSTGRGSYITSGGDPAVGNLTASFSGNTVTITPLSGYSFSGMSYTAFVCYV